ncbi:hypothetical protein ACFL3E_00480 [Patescibacteria group bacterium]
MEEDNKLLKKAGLGRTYRYLRARASNELVGDISLFIRAIEILRVRGKNLSYKSIVHHFKKNISKDDYKPRERKEILKSLC